MDFEALLLTLRLAATTTVVLLGVALPLAWWLAGPATRGGRVWRALVQALVALPLVLPPTVIGFYLLVGLGPLTPVGRGLIRVLGHPLAFSFTGLLVGSMLYSLPFAVQPLVAGFHGVDREYAEAASLLGKGPVVRFLSITLPLARPAVLTAAVLTFLHTVGEFGVVLMIGGNMAGTTRTLSISLYDLFEDGRYEQANRTALLLVGMALAGLCAVYARSPGRGRLDRG